MQRPSYPANEAERIADLYEYGILDTAPEEDFDSLVRVAADICNTPIAAITFVDSERQWFKARQGLIFPQTSRDHSFCAYTILHDGLFLVHDTLEHQVFRHFPYVTGGPGIRFYAGISLYSHHGRRIGSLCVMDERPRYLDGYQQRALSALSRLISQLLENRRLHNRLKKVAKWQTRFQELLAKEVRSPLSSTGTFLNTLEHHSGTMIPAPGVTAQFLRTLTIFNCLLEWGKVHEQEGNKPWPTIDAGQLVTDVIRKVKRDHNTRRFTFTDTHKAVSCLDLPGHAVGFVVKLVLLWLCDIAEEGEITFHELTLENGNLRIGISLRSRSFLPRLHRRMEKLVHGPLWPEGIHNPTEELYLMLAKDILNELNGDLNIDMGPGLIDTVIKIRSIQ